jgi:hypothetical protein
MERGARHPVKRGSLCARPRAAHPRLYLEKMVPPNLEASLPAFGRIHACVHQSRAPGVSRVDLDSYNIADYIVIWWP